MRIIPINQNYKNYHNNKKLSFKSVTPNLKEIERIKSLADSMYHEAEKRYNALDYSYVGYDGLYEKEDVARIFRKVNEMYNYINSLYNSNISSNSDSKNIIEKFLTAQRLLNSNAGFNKVIGNEDVKQRLYQEFAIEKILGSQIDENIKVPNVVLFYGPSGCGKTFFATALAEQSLCDIKIIDTSEFDTQEKTFSDIFVAAKESRNNFAQTGHRTMIVVNEINELFDKKTSINSEFMDFIKKCSEEYKCTLFLTTNNPLDISEEILSENITPIKVALPPPTLDNIEEYLEKNFKLLKKSVNIQELMSILTKTPDKQYSFSNIAIAFMSLARTNPNFNDIELIKHFFQNIRPINKASLKLFNEAKKSFK